MHNMVHLCGWRLGLDKPLSGVRHTDIACMRTFVERVGPCLHPNTCMGVQLIPKLAPNILCHFKPHGGWPTGDVPLGDLSCPAIVSFIAQAYKIIPI
jgi:hypothetical protein